MVWASIWVDERGRARRSKLVMMERDPDALKGGHSAQNYIKALTEGSCLTGGVRSSSCMIGLVYTGLLL
jgi:hypothetical protein